MKKWNLKKVCLLLPVMALAIFAGCFVGYLVCDKK